jgi:hypothetical protein
MGLAWSDIRLVEAPLWGQDWAPAENVRIVLAANPWGAQLDPALVRRVYPLPTGFSEKVLDLFEEPVKGAIRASWEAVENGQLALPMEYQLLLTAKRPDDASIITPYMHKLRALDPASAEGFEVILTAWESGREVRHEPESHFPKTGIRGQNDLNDTGSETFTHCPDRCAFPG